MVDFGIQIVVSSIFIWKKTGLILEDNAEIWWQKKGKCFWFLHVHAMADIFWLKNSFATIWLLLAHQTYENMGCYFHYFPIAFVFVEVLFRVSVTGTCQLFSTWPAKPAWFSLHGMCVCVFITWHMCVHYMACVCSIHVMFWFQKIQIIFCQACGATIFLLPYNQSFAQSRCDVAMHKAHAHANILHGHISYMTFVECASPSVACVLAAWAHWFMLLILHAMGTSGANVPSEPYMQQWRESEEFCLGDHPPGAYLQCDAVGCTGRSWIWCWRLNERNQRCRHCRQFWSNVFLSSGYRFWAWQATRQWPAYLQL